MNDQQIRKAINLLLEKGCKEEAAKALSLFVTQLKREEEGTSKRRLQSLWLYIEMVKRHTSSVVDEVNKASPDAISQRDIAVWLRSRGGSLKDFFLYLDNTPLPLLLTSLIEECTCAVEECWETNRSTSNKEAKFYVDLLRCLTAIYRGDREMSIKMAEQILRSSGYLDRRGENYKLRVATICSAAGLSAGQIESSLRITIPVKTDLESDRLWLWAGFLSMSGRYKKALQIYNGIMTSAVLHGKKLEEARLYAGLCELIEGSTDTRSLLWYQSRFSSYMGHYPHLETWKGEADVGIVIYPEQGLGDQLFFLRLGEAFDSCFAEVKTYYEVDPRIRDISRHIYPKLRVFSTGDSVEFDIRRRLPIGSLAYWISKKGSEPSELSRNAGLRSRLMRKDSRTRVIRIGILWKSLGTQYSSVKSSTPNELVEAIRLCRYEGEIVSFQHNTSTREDKYLRSEGITTVNTSLEKDTREMAVDELTSCALFVGISGTMTHLAASLGLPTIVLLDECHGSGYSWANRDGKPYWYGSNVIVASGRANWRTAISRGYERYIDGF